MSERRPTTLTEVEMEFDWALLPYHPSAVLFHDPAFAVAVGGVHPSLLRWLVAESPRFFRQNVMWLYVYALAVRAYCLEPPRLLICCS